MDLFEVIVGWLILGALVGAWAQSRGRSFFGFMAVSVLLSPLVGFVVVAALSNKVEDDKRRAQQVQDQIERENERRMEHERQLEQLRAMTTAAQRGAAPAASVAEEIARLADLKDKGVLTAEEFDVQKRKALGA